MKPEDLIVLVLLVLLLGLAFVGVLLLLVPYLILVYRGASLLMPGFTP